MSSDKGGYVSIDKLTIRLPSGWQGDPVYLARQIAEQIQAQASDMQNSNRLSLSLHGEYAGVSTRVTQQFSKQLSKQLTGNGRIGGKND